MVVHGRIGRSGSSAHHIRSYDGHRIEGDAMFIGSHAERKVVCMSRHVAHCFAVSKRMCCESELD